MAADADALAKKLALGGSELRFLQAQDLSEPELPEVPSGQPPNLRLLRAMLEAAGDPDREFLRQAEDGLPVGILDPLPRTPHVSRNS